MRTFQSRSSNGLSWAAKTPRFIPVYSSLKHSIADTYFTYNRAVELAAQLQASLQELTASGIVEVRENGGSIAPFSGMSWEVRGDGEKPLLHLWSEQFNLTRRVLAITDHSEYRLALAVQRFGHNRPDRLEFIRRNSSAVPASFRTRSSGTASPIFWPNSSRMKRSNRWWYFLTSNIRFPATTPGDSSAAVPHTSPFWQRRTESRRTWRTIASPLHYSGCGMSANQMIVEG